MTTNNPEAQAQLDKALGEVGVPPGLAEYNDFPNEDTHNDVDDGPKQEAKGAVERINSRIVGYHFSGLSFYPGKHGVREVFLGDPGIPGVISVKVIYSGTGKRSSIFTVPSQILVAEEEELPFAIVGA